MRYLILTALILGCSKPMPKLTTTYDGQKGYELPYCVEASDCYTLASKTCPKGYEVASWNGHRPRVVVCN